MIQSPVNVEPAAGGWRQVLSLEELGIGPEMLLRLDALGVRSINDLPRLAALSFEEPLVMDPETAESGAETLVRRLAGELYDGFMILEPCHLILGVEDSHTHVAYSFGLTSSTLQVTVSTRLLPEDVEDYLDGLPSPGDESTVAVARRSSLVDPFADLERVARDVGDGGRLSKVIDLRFGLTDGQRKRTLAEVGALFGVTRERARQDEAKCLRLFNTLRIRRSLRRLTQLVAGVSESLEASPDDPLVETYLMDWFPAAPRPLLPWLRLLAAVNADRWAHLHRSVVHGVDAAVADVLAAKVQLSFTDLVGEVANRLGTPDSLGLRARVRGSRLFSMEGDIVRLGDVAHPDRTSRRVRRLGAMKEVLGSEGPMHFAELAAKIRPLLDPDDSMNLRNVHAWLDRFHEYFVWVGPGTYRLRAEGDGRLEREALPERYAPSRRRGVGDAVVALLLERQPRSLPEIESHVMPRFVVNRSSIEASILQDRARRFVMTDEKLVYLSDADIASFEASRPRLAGVMDWNELAADLGDWADAVLGDGPEGGPQPGTK